MANTKISALTANTNPSGSEEFVYAYNNANGKISLNTMKTFASAGSQPTLVSGTNIKTINGDSILGSGNLVVSGGGGGGGDSSFDAVIDAGGGGDYTSVSAAIAAGKYNLFIKNGNYNETAGWNPYANNKSFLHIVGESESGVVISFPDTMTTANGYMIDMRYGSAADFYMENVTCNIMLTSTNAIFYRDNGGSNFIVKNCTFNYDTNVATPSDGKHYLFYSKVIDDSSNGVEAGRLNSGIFGCEFNITTTKIINISWEVMSYFMCQFHSTAGRVQLVQLNNKAKLYNCYVDAYELGGLKNLESYNSYINVGHNVYDGDGYNLSIERIDSSILKLGALQNTPTLIQLGACTDSEMDFGTYDITGDAIFNHMESAQEGCRITCGKINPGHNLSGCYISATSLEITQGNKRVFGNRFANTLTSATIGASGVVLDGNVFLGTGTMSVSGNNNIITSNHMANMSISDTGTGNVKANNVTA